MVVKYVIPVVERNYYFRDNSILWPDVSYYDEFKEYKTILESNGNMLLSKGEKVVVKNKTYEITDIFKNVEDDLLFVVLDNHVVNTNEESLLKAYKEYVKYFEERAEKWKKELEKTKKELEELKEDVRKNYRKKWFRIKK